MGATVRDRPRCTIDTAGLLTNIERFGFAVSESVMNEEQQRTVDTRLRAAVESSPSGLIMTDQSGRIVLVNREVERLFGYSREELLGKVVDVLVPERFRHNHPGFRAGFLADPRVRAMGVGRDLFGLRKDGSEVAV